MINIGEDGCQGDIKAYTVLRLHSRAMMTQQNCVDPEVKVKFDIGARGIVSAGVTITVEAMVIGVVRHNAYVLPPSSSFCQWL